MAPPPPPLLLRFLPATSRFYLPPEGVDGDVEQVGDLLEGLVRFLGQDLEPGTGDGVGDDAAVARRGDHVQAARQHERRHGDVREPAGGVVDDKRVDAALDGLGGRLVREGHHLLDDLLDRAVLVGAGGVDPHVERLEEGPLAGRDFRQPAPGSHRGAEERVRTGPGAHQDQAADERGVPEREFLRDGAAAGKAGHVRGGDVERSQQRGGVIGHGGHRERLGRQRRAAHPAVVVSDEPVAVREPVQLELPGLGGIAEPGDEQDIRPGSLALDPHVQGPRAYVLAHLSSSLRPGVPALRVLSVGAQVSLKEFDRHSVIHPVTTSAPLEVWNRSRNGLGGMGSRAK